ncbi:MAG: hypothetical protein ACOY4W_14285 [Thermodesulfobacteriota bacterium]
MIKLEIISAICLGIASIGFILLPFCIEKRLSDAYESLQEIDDSIYRALDQWNQSNFHASQAYINRSSTFILDQLNADHKKINKVSEAILQEWRIACTHSINANMAIGAIDTPDISILDTISTPEDFSRIYLQCMTIFSEGNKKLVENGKLLKLKINKYRRWKNTTWSICLFFNSIGIIVGILVIARTN